MGCKIDGNKIQETNETQGIKKFEIDDGGLNVASDQQ